MTAAPAPGQASPGEYQVKAAFIYNFLKFIEWPARKSMERNSLSMCLFGAPLPEDAFAGLKGQEIMGRSIAVTPIRFLEHTAGCEVLFIGASEAKQIEKIRNILRGSGTLTIGDTAGFAEHGVIINFYFEADRVRFEINAAAARQAGLTISSKLMKLAGAVYESTATGD